VDCTILFDDFNRETLGSNWTVKSGSASIVDNKIELTTGTRVITTVQHPKQSVTGRVTAEVYGVASGTEHRVLVGYDVADDTHAWAEYRDTGTSGFHSVGEDGGAACEEVEIGNMSDGEVLGVCRGFDEVQGGISTPTARCCTGDDPKDAYTRAGLENTGTETIQFDNFLWEEHYETNNNCKQCDCQCEGFCIPKTLILTFEASGDCSCLDGYTISLPTEIAPPSCWWSGQRTLCHPFAGCECWGDPGGTTNYYFKFNAEGATPDDFFLCLMEAGDCVEGWGLPGGPSGCAYTSNPATYTCDPFSMTFGPFNCSTTCEPSGGCTCTYSLILTEAP
jgi:hypothetical protein